MFLVHTLLLLAIMLVSIYWKAYRWAYISVISFSSSILTFSMHALNSLRLPSSFLACLRYSSSSLILVSFFFLAKQIIEVPLCFYGEGSVMDVMESGSWLMYSSTIISMRTDNDCIVWLEISSPVLVWFSQWHCQIWTSSSSPICRFYRVCKAPTPFHRIEDECWEFLLMF